MSELSEKNREYLDLAGIARLVTDALLIYKRVTRRLPGSDSVGEAEFVEAEQQLTEFVDLLIAGLGEITPDLPSAIADLAERIRDQQGAELQYFQQDLVKIRDSLANGRALSDGEIHILEGISAHTDQEAARAFRSLWTT
jgi:hypothetical protein